MRSSGERKRIQSIGAGASARMATYDGHRWLATRHGVEAPIMEFTVALGAGLEQTVHVGAPLRPEL